MGAPTPLWIRQQVIEDRLNGLAVASIATRHQISESSVRIIWRRYQTYGMDGLAADYSACGRPASDRRIYRAARYLKYLHRDWGAPLIRILLEERYGDQVPSARTLQRWFKAAGLGVPRQRRPVPDRTKGGEVHQVWQIDAKERLPSKASYLSIVDEHSGAFLETPVFPPRPHRSSAPEPDASGLDGDV